MYQVFYNDLPLHDLRSETLRLRDPDVHLAVGEAGEMAFTIDDDHPYAGQLARMKGVVKLLDDGRALFRGRVRKDARDFNLSRRIEVEGLLACLNDSLVPPFNFPGDFENDAAYQAAAETGNVIQFFLDWLLAEHNSQVSPDQQIRLGLVTVSDPNNYITRASSEYLTTMEVVKKKLVDLLGGHLLADYSSDTTVLHYYDTLPMTNIQEVEFGVNLLDLEDELDSADTYTAILPVGKDGLTLEDLDDGEISPGVWKSGKIIYSAEAEEELDGVRVIHVEKWDDVTLAENLRRKAADKLTTEGVKTVQTIKVKAVDLSGYKESTVPLENTAVVGRAVVGQAVVGVGLVDDSLPHFVVGRYVRFKSRPHGFADAYPLMELDPNILDPGDTEITLGATVLTASGLAHRNQSAAEEGQNRLQIELNNQRENINAMPQVIESQVTEAIQTCEAIIFSALESYVKTGDYESYQQEVSAQLSILAGSITAKFTEVSERVTDVDGDLQLTVETLAKYFEFGIDGLTIKAGENAMTLELDNGLISFQKNGQQFGWWDGVDFHTGNIVIDVSERAQFGNFAFVPRSNGSLSFLKVGG